MAGEGGALVARIALQDGGSDGVVGSKLDQGPGKMQLNQGPVAHACLLAHLGEIPNPVLYPALRMALKARALNQRFQNGNRTRIA